MEEKVRLLICLSASVAANCIPCFKHYYHRCLEIGLTREDIDEAVELAGQVKRGAHIALASLIKEMVGQEPGKSKDSFGGAKACC